MVDPILGPLMLEQIDRRIIAQIAARKGPTNATRRRDLTAISQVLRAAVNWGWTERNTARDFDRSVIRERRDPVRLPTDRDIATLVGACPNAMLQSLVHTL